MQTQFTSVDDLVESIGEGTRLALAPDYSGCSMRVIEGLMRVRRTGLNIVAVPQIGFQGDMLIGAGCVESVEAAAITLGEFGQARRFCEAVEQRRIRMIDSTCPVIHAGLQAAEKGVPFMPLRGVIGSDIEAHRDDWHVIDNPFNDAKDPILLFPAIVPDVALFHAPKADRNGNVWVGIRRELMTMAHAARRTLVTVEEIVDDDLMADDAIAAGCIPSIYISDIAQARDGARPVGLFSCYGADADALSAYAEAARTQQGFNNWLADLDARGERERHASN